VTEKGKLQNRRDPSVLYSTEKIEVEIVCCPIFTQNGNFQITGETLPPNSDFSLFYSLKIKNNVYVSIAF
jgi:hypothetical protein